MPVVNISTPFNIDIDFDIAEFHKRLLAYLIDMLLLFIFWISMHFLLLGGFDLEYTASYGFITLVVLLPMLFYSMLCELLMGGQTVGKKIMSIKVISLTGGDPLLGQVMLRWFVRFYEWGSIIFIFFWMNPFFGFSMMFMGGITSVIIIVMSGKSQRLGDIVAGTVVVNTKTNLTVKDTIFMQVNQQNYVVSFPEVMRLSDRDINTIKNVLTQARKSNNYEMANRVAYKVQEVLKVSSTMYAVEFLDKILEDYNYLATKE